MPRFWAQQKVAELSLFADRNADELAKVGKAFNLVTPNTSLLVLETADQYVQHRVVPPKDRPEVYQGVPGEDRAAQGAGGGDEGAEGPAGAGDVGRSG